MSKRARVNRILAVLGVLWGALIVSQGIPTGSGSYGAGQLAAFVFGFALIGVGIWTLVRPPASVAGSDDDDDEFGADADSWFARWLRRVGIVAAAVVLLIGAVAGYVRMHDERADDLAVKYGAVSANGEVTLADRCTGMMRESYNREGGAATLAFPPKSFAFIAPKVCAAGVERGYVESNGAMTEEQSKEVTLVAIERYGAARFQRMVFDELAVSQYHLAKAGHTTRRDRCVAMGYSGWDGQPEKSSLPPREVFFRAVRQTCDAAIEQGMVPASGAPLPDSAEFAALQRLLLAKLQQLAPR